MNIDYNIMSGTQRQYIVDGIRINIRANIAYRIVPFIISAIGDGSAWF